MQNLFHGLQHFKASAYPRKQSLFEELHNGQSPHTLFITCSDSRIDPNLLTQSEPGEIFVIRNAGNLVPHNELGSGEVATIEYAVKALKVPNIVVCGHSKCGAMQAVTHPEATRELPSVAAWLRNTDGILERTLRRCGEQSPDHLLDSVIQENVRMQLENLRSLRCVADAMANDQLRLHGWTYDIRSGEVAELNQQQDAFAPLCGDAFEPVDKTASGFA